MLQKAWARNDGRTEPVRMKRNAEYHPKMVVYVKWNAAWSDWEPSRRRGESEPGG